MKLATLVALLALTSTPLISTPLSAAEPLDMGLTSKSARIEGFAVAASAPPDVKAGPASLPTVVLIGGLTGEDESVDRVRKALEAHDRQKPARRLFNLIAI